MLAALGLSLDRLMASVPPDADDWWLIGSTAALLAGIALMPDDVDLFGGTATLDAVVRNLGGATVSGSPSQHFRSTPFCRITIEGGLPIEVMGDLEVGRDGQWRPLRIRTRIPVSFGSGQVYVPDLAEQAAIFELFGRPKDMAKAALVYEKLQDIG